MNKSEQKRELFDRSVESLAKYVLLSKADKIDIELSKNNLEYRKGKSDKDIFNAREKALKNGMLKTEIELKMLEFYLKSIVKLVSK